MGKIDYNTLQNQQFYYTIKLDIGFPPQFFEVLVDSSNEVTWVPTTKCKNCGQTLNVYKYPQNMNDTRISRSLELSNNGNRLSGDVLIDYDVVHDTKDNLKISVRDMEILLVNEVPSNFSDYVPGKLSLSYKSRDNFDFLDALKKQNLINRRLFAIAEEGLEGKLYIGDLPKVIQENMRLYTTCDVTENIKWSTTNKRYINGLVCQISHAYMGERTGLMKIHNETKTTDFLEISGYAYFNTGSFVIRVPDKYFRLIVENYLELNLGSVCTLVDLKTERYYKCPKEKVDFYNINPISFIIDGWAYEVPSYYLFVLSDDLWNYEFLIRTTKNNDNIWSFGQPFFRQYITVFDKDKKQVGFYCGEKLKFNQKNSEITETTTMAKQVDFISS